ncbi:hypothetical protein AcV7_005133 [Taiwanofungus camphoratus]|nr:hypothetical protein AcV7_005133 [Antrodia cinnamomea]
MFYMKDGFVMGVLCDWDVAMKEPSKEQYIEDDNEHNQEDQVDEDVIFDYAAMAGDNKTDDPLTRQARALTSKAHKESCKEAHKESCKEGTRSKDQEKSELANALDIALVQVHSCHPIYCQREGFLSIVTVTILSRYDTWVFQSCGHVAEPIQEWECSELSQIGSNKRSFIQDQSHYRSALSSAHPDYATLAVQWVVPLHILLTCVAAVQLELRDERTRAKAKSNSNTVESINAAITQLNARREELITYETFMECLDISTSELQRYFFMQCLLR